MKIIIKEQDLWNLDTSLLCVWKVLVGCGLPLVATGQGKVWEFYFESRKIDILKKS